MAGTRRSRKQSTIKSKQRKSSKLKKPPYGKLVAEGLIGVPATRAASRAARATARVTKKAMKNIGSPVKGLKLGWDILTKADTTYIKKKYFSRPSTSKDRKGR